MATLLYNGRIFQSSGLVKPEHHFETCIAFDAVSSRILHVGSESDPEILRLGGPDKSGFAQATDMQGKFILPGFIDGHMHFLTLGQSMTKLSLAKCQNLEDIVATLKEYAAAHPEVPRILAGHWMHHMTGDQATAAALADIDPRPIFIESKDLHFQWCNDAALAEMDLADTPDPKGGKIVRDESGKPAGLVSENAVMTIVWPHLAKVAAMDAKVASLSAALDAYCAAGYTGMIEMAMDEGGWEAALELRRQRGGVLPVRLAAYWCLMPKPTEAETLAEIDRAAALRDEFNTTTSPDCRITGIKFICDGVIDACTAALKHPYASGEAAGDPIWTAAMLGPAVARATHHGLQVALHAIGDETVHVAVEAIAAHAPARLRPRIEHLELTAPEDVARLGALGITASIHPVHADPAILREWPRLLGAHRCGRAFAYPEFADAGSVLAIGSDAPSAPLDPLPNLYTATTRRSAREPLSTDTVNPHFALELAHAVTAATAGTAYSVFDENETGALKKGLRADIVVVDMQWEAHQLLQAKVLKTYSGGVLTFDAEA
ncbi:Exoenzymes regulatory protein AepA [Ceratocystis fimbriata CBS 114723]|uniref:Exoenzymes regulatory protein AepA n=1 Tax=Ceratocystis fimbriata CBS 114723 TaxID=1035309 RepID=A0A2C5XAD8_9PEZI|nr:Exoenzymes regulatory protein AepA [Ceratocystis fimbriata CBS 114723]